MKSFYLFFASLVIVCAAVTVMFTQHALADKRDYKTHLREEIKKAENKYRARIDEARDQHRRNHDTELKEQNDRVANRLNKDRLQKCQENSDNITRVMQKASENGTQQLATLDQVAKRVQEFYQSHEYHVEHYDDLVSIINQNRDESVAALSQMNVDGQNFKCDGDNPADSLEAYRAAHQAKNTALKEYKTSVRELILAVKSSVSSKHKDAT